MTSNAPIARSDCRGRYLCGCWQKELKNRSRLKKRGRMPSPHISLSGPGAVCPGRLLVPETKPSAPPAPHQLQPGPSEGSAESLLQKYSLFSRAAFHQVPYDCHTTAIQSGRAVAIDRLSQALVTRQGRSRAPTFHHILHLSNDPRLIGGDCSNLLRRSTSLHAKIASSPSIIGDAAGHSLKLPSFRCIPSTTHQRQ